jgi:putative spermidine/putrescine transport system permease protein
MWRRPWVVLLVVLGVPLAWLLLVYVGSLASLLLNSLYETDPFTSDVVKHISLSNFRDLVTDRVYRTVTLRTIGVATAVTVIDMAIALPMAFFMAKVARPRLRRWLVVAVLMPLWASYLVKGYAWRAILDPASGVLTSSLGFSPGFGLTAAVIVLAYLWMPYMLLPIYAGLDRLPDSLLEASSDLGAKSGQTFRSVVLPLVKPSLIAGSILTFSLSLGDYITIQLVGGKTQMIGNVVYANFGAPNLPFAAAFAVVPVLIIVIYLLVVRRTGAFEDL